MRSFLNFSQKHSNYCSIITLQRARLTPIFRVATAAVRVLLYVPSHERIISIITLSIPSTFHLVNISRPLIRLPRNVQKFRSKFPIAFDLHNFSAALSHCKLEFIGYIICVNKTKIIYKHKTREK